MEKIADAEYNLARDIEKYGELYNKAHKYFCHHERRAAIWKALNSIYKIDAKEKWKSMRMRLWKERRKKNFTWDLFPHLRFLENHVQPKQQGYPTPQFNPEDAIPMYDEVQEETDVSRDAADSSHQEELSDEETRLTTNKTKSLYEFAQEVEKYGELYDKRHIHFFNHKQKEAIWKALSTKYKMDAKVKWALMRDRFGKEKKKNRTYWHLYPYLTFLEKHINHQQRKNKIYLEHPIDISNQADDNEMNLEDDIPAYVLEEENVEKENAEKGNAFPWSEEEASSDKAASAVSNISHNNSHTQQGNVFRDDILYEFVQEVEKHGELYNKAHTHFSNFERKEAIWKALSEKYKMDAKARWNIMRERFSREKRKENSVWHLYPYLYFLEHHIQHRQGRKKTKHFEIPIETQHHRSIEEEKPSKNPLDDSANVTQSYDSPKRKFAKRENSNNSQCQPFFDVLDEVPQKIINDSVDDDDNEDWHFLQSLKYKMRKMRDEEKTQFKIEMLLQAEKAVLNSKTYF